MGHRIIPRAEWGARHDNGAGARRLPCRETWLHHSVTIAPDLLPPFDDDHAAVRALEKIGEQRFKRGISYTFLVTPAGLIFEGHSIDRVGSHTAGHNTVGAGICLIGNYDADAPPEPMLDAVGWLLAHGYFNGWWDAVPLDGGHRDTKPTACPGRFAYAELQNINGRAKAHANGGVQLPPDTPTPHPPPAGDAYAMDRINLAGPLPVKGRHVDNLQGLLLAAAKPLKLPTAGLTGSDGLPDGVAGPGTAAALEAFQAKAKFLGAYTGAVDRDCGPATWRALIEF
jgi:hypothetical protein